MKTYPVTSGTIAYISTKGYIIRYLKYTEFENIAL